MSTQLATVDEEKVAAFGGKVFTDMTSWCAVVLSALGDRLGLFTALEAYGPATPEELAASAGVNRRYLQEWLSAMACAGYLEYHPQNRRFQLPVEHAPVLAHEDGPAFAGGSLQLMSFLPGVLDKIVSAFQNGGGVAQTEYDLRLWEAMERESAPAFEHLLLPVWIPTVPEVEAKLAQGALVADIGCGSGRALINLAKAFPNSRFVGYDAFQPQVDRAIANARAAGVEDRVRFERRDGSSGLPEQYDVITTFDVVHDAADPRGLLRSIREALRPNGIYLIMEFNYSERLEENIGPMGTFLYSASVLYCMTLSLGHGGAGLGTAGLPEPKLRELAAEAGFRTVRRLPIDDEFHALYALDA